MSKTELQVIEKALEELEAQGVIVKGDVYGQIKGHSISDSLYQRLVKEIDDSVLTKTPMDPVCETVSVVITPPSPGLKELEELNKWKDEVENYIVSELEKSGSYSTEGKLEEKPDFKTQYWKLKDGKYAGRDEGKGEPVLAFGSREFTQLVGVKSTYCNGPTALTTFTTSDPEMKKRLGHPSEEDLSIELDESPDQGGEQNPQLPFFGSIFLDFKPYDVSGNNGFVSYSELQRHFAAIEG